MYHSQPLPSFLRWVSEHIHDSLIPLSLWLNPVSHLQCPSCFPLSRNQLKPHLFIRAYHKYILKIIKFLLFAHPSWKKLFIGCLLNATHSAKLWLGCFLVMVSKGSNARSQVTFFHIGNTWTRFTFQKQHKGKEWGTSLCLTLPPA